MATFVGLTVLVIIANTVQVSRAKRFSFRQIMSGMQICTCFVVLLAFLTKGNTPSFQFWSTLAFFLIGVGEGIEIGSTLKNVRIEGKDKKREIIIALNNAIAVFLPVVLFLVSLSLITGYIPPFLK